MSASVSDSSDRENEALRRAQRAHEPSMEEILASIRAIIADDRDAEVERLVALGARRADIGQGQQSWVVLADPEGNEFCVLGPRPTS